MTLENSVELDTGPLGRKEKRSLRKKLESSVASSASKVIKLHSGKTVVFHLRQIPAEHIESMTFVDQDVNGRDQNFLSKVNVAEISSTFSDNQYYPAFGYKKSNKIGLIDGSRRRFVAIQENTPFDVFVCDEEVSKSDLVLLARNMQTAKPHSMREEGLKFALLEKGGVERSAIADSFNKSKSYVSRAIDVSKLNEKWFLLFPNPEKIQSRTLVSLIKVDKTLISKSISVDEMYTNVCAALIKSHGKGNEPFDSYENKKSLSYLTDEDIMKEINYFITRDDGVKNTSEGFKHSPMRNFKNKSRRAKVSIKGDLRRFELKGFDDDVYQEINSKILELLAQYE